MVQKTSTKDVIVIERTQHSDNNGKENNHTCIGSLPDTDALRASNPVFGNEL